MKGMVEKEAISGTSFNAQDTVTRHALSLESRQPGSGTEKPQASMKDVSRAKRSILGCEHVRRRLVLASTGEVEVEIEVLWSLRDICCLLPYFVLMLAKTPLK